MPNLGALSAITKLEAGIARTALRLDSSNGSLRAAITATSQEQLAISLGQRGDYRQVVDLLTPVADEALAQADQGDKLSLTAFGIG